MNILPLLSSLRSDIESFSYRVSDQPFVITVADEGGSHRLTSQDMWLSDDNENIDNDKDQIDEILISFLILKELERCGISLNNTEEITEKFNYITDLDKHIEYIKEYYAENIHSVRGDLKIILSLEEELC